MTNTLGPTKTKSELDIYKGTPVRITTTHGSAMGIVNDISSEYLSLKPTYINHGCYIDNKFMDHYKFQDKLPQKVKLFAIVGVEPLEEGYMEWVTGSFNYNSNPPKIIMPPFKKELHLQLLR